MPHRLLVLVLLACFSLVGLGLSAGPVPVEVPNRSQKKLEELSTHIVTGEVVAIYERKVEDRSWATTYRIAEINVEAVEKGELEVESGPIYVRYWDRSWTGGSPPPTSTNGHRGLPSEGDSLRIYLARNAYDGFGTSNEDGGLNVLGPNGFAPLEKK